MNLILYLYLAYTQFILGLYPVLRTFLYSCTGILILVVVMLLILLLIINTEKLNLHAHDQFKESKYNFLSALLFKVLIVNHQWYH